MIASVAILAGLAAAAVDVKLAPKDYAVPADGRLFSYNTVLGPIIQIPYDNSALIDGAETIGLGSIRYPGGTVADYWSMRLGNYINDCSRSLCSCCEFQPSIAKFPTGTFLPKAVLAPGSIGRTTTSTPVFDVNVLTFNTTAEAIADVQSLAEQVTSPSDVEIFEMGNEFYLTNYRWRFPNSSTYMEAAKPIAAEGRKLFPDALVMAVANQGQLKSDSCGGSWNSQLSAFKESYDGVTLHDYSITNKSVGSHFPPSQWNTVVAAWSSASVQLAMKGVDACFGKDTLVAQTEFNYAGGEGQGFGPTKSGPLLAPYGAIHGIFQADRILEAARHVTDTPTPARRREAARSATGEPSAAAASSSSSSVKWSRYVSMHMHALAEDTAVNWDHNSGVLRFNASLGPDARPEVSGVGQVFAHLTRAARPAPWSSFATKPNGQTAAGGSSHQSSTSPPPPASYFIPLEQSGSEHPTIGFAIKDQTGLPCLQASLFASDPGARTSPRFAIINRCTETLTAVLPAFDPAQADAWLYSAEDEGGWAPLPSKDAPVPWTSGPLSPRRASVSCSSGGCAVTMPGVCMAISAGAQ